MRRGPVQSLAASPTLVGALTVLIIIVAVFLAYNANRGLPFVPTYRISAQVPNAESLTPGNDVRVGGVRVGVVEDSEPVQHEDGSVTAKLELKLDREVEPLPEDSTVVVRPRSVLGLKYLQIHRGSSARGLPEGGTLSLSAAQPQSVELDQVFDAFDEPTRAGIQANLTEFGNALAGRGSQLNAALGELPPLLERLEPVARDIAEPSTGLARLLRALEASASEVAPVAETQGQLLVDLDSTFGALARVARPFIQESISKTPPTLDTATAALPVIRPFLRHSQALFADLEPATRELVSSTPAIADALEAGVPALRRSPALNAQLAPTANALVAFGDDPRVTTGLDFIAQTSRILGPPLRFITPAQTVCNYATLVFGNTARLTSAGDGIGTWQRFIVLNPPEGRNNEGSPSSAPADGPELDNHLHLNPYPNTAAPGQPRECEAGNERYAAGDTVIGNVRGGQGTTTEGQP
jgi:phospholipid/cholesterol/gamma-HCH transport system substrate-binding protein